MSTEIEQDQVQMAQDALSTFYHSESPGFAMAGAAHAILATLDTPCRTVVQYDFRDDETWAYCNDGTIWVRR